LLVLATGVMNVLTAVITGEGENMSKTITEEQGAAPASSQVSKPDRKARAGARSAQGAPAKAKSTKKGQPYERSAQARDKGQGPEAQFGPRRQQNGADPGPAQATGRRYGNGHHGLRFTLHLARMMTGILVHLAFPW
jgi:hypothetical protein